MTRSQTQRDLAVSEIADLVTYSLGPDCAVTSATELTGGGFAAVWRVDLADGRSVVLKTSPPPGAKLLTYERGLLAAEAEYFQRVRQDAAGVPVPEVLYHGSDPGRWDGEWMITTLLPGAALTEVCDRISAESAAAVRREVGRALAQLHSLTGPEFGYPGHGRRRGASWREVFLGIIADTLEDADRLGSDLPAPAADIQRILSDASTVLDQVRRPTLVHFDLWDGNILVTGGDPEPAATESGVPEAGAAEPGTVALARLSGLVDGERCVYADPLVDFVSADVFGTIETQPAHPFLLGYAEAQGRPVEWTDEEITRIRLYRAWLYLVMVVEIPTRALAGDAHAEHRRFRAQVLRDSLTALTPGAA
jgi:aminoglycoside phosphotransferase (APT) family kinase protein